MLTRTHIPLSPLERRRELLTRLLNAKRAEIGLLDYTRFTMPDFHDHGHNPASRYITGRHHELIASKMEQLETGQVKRLIINCAPRHGKSELGKRFMSWFSARHPEKSLIFGTYNETFAGDNGRAVRDIIQSHEHQFVFPNHLLADGSEAAQRLATEDGGILTFAGRGGSITGRGGHGIVIDDPLKDRTEADSKTVREKLWTWFTQVANTRLMDSDSWILLIQTRWHEDDLVGRLTDPTNAYYDPDQAAQWEIIDLPAISLEDEVDALGRGPNEALWPERFDLKFLENQRSMDPRGFQALYQGRPSPTDGNFFQASDLLTYRRDELPKNLRYYVASDHAVSTTQAADKTAMIPVGVDENDDIWVLPDVFWRNTPTDVTVEGMLNLMRVHKPLFWWAERGQITKSIGPFLRKRMSEEGVYASIIEVTPIGDKQARAQSIHARIAMRKVRFPEFAPWWPLAKDQMLKFPYAAHDDFVDALAYIGLGLSMQVGAGAMRHAAPIGKKGTFRSMFAQIREDQSRERRMKNSKGW